MLLDPAASEELYRILNKRHTEVFGEMMPCTKAEALRYYCRNRKGNYKRLRDGKPIRPTETQPVLFGDPVPQGGVATLYAYIGSTALCNKRVIKIGYTGDTLKEYLAKKVIAHNPELLATRIGGEREEGIELAILRNFVVVGNEWHRPCLPVFNRLRAEWHLEHGFELSVARVLREWQ